VSNQSEIRLRLGRLAKLSSKMREQLTKFSGPEGLEMREKAKQQGKRIGIGAGIAIFGIIVVTGAAIYINALLIILLDLAMPLWAAALIVVFGMFIFGGVVAGIGVGIARKAAKDLPKLGGDTAQSIKDAADEMKETVEELQDIAKKEAEERQKQMQEMIAAVKPVVPFIIGAYVGYRVLKRVSRSRKARRIILEQLELD
jgi:Putative Actinobacterial Holin-X, holin superfamily III